MNYDLIIFLGLLALGYGFGQYAEKKHFRSIIEREEKFRQLAAFSTRFPPPQSPTPDTELVSGSVVISIDYFKRFVSGLRNLVGGRVHSYESLVERARREAVLRMKQDASDKGAQAIFNVKLETASISKNARGQIGSIEVFAYGTAVIPVS